MCFLFSFISSLDFKPLFAPIDLKRIPEMSIVTTVISVNTLTVSHFCKHCYVNIYDSVSVLMHFCTGLGLALRLSMQRSSIEQLDNKPELPMSR